jgi:hypothetical protein
MNTVISSVKLVLFLHSNLYAFYFFLSSLSLYCPTRISSTRLNTNGDSGQSCCIPSIREKTLSFNSKVNLSLYICVGFVCSFIFILVLHMSFIRFRVIFYQIWDILSLQNSFSVWWVILINIQMITNLHSWNKLSFIH